MSPHYQPHIHERRKHYIKLSCQITVDGEEIKWKEIFPDTDFESRAEGYFDYMKYKIIEAMKKKKHG